MLGVGFLSVLLLGAMVSGARFQDGEHHHEGLHHENGDTYADKIRVKELIIVDDANPTKDKFSINARWRIGDNARCGAKVYPVLP